MPIFLLPPCYKFARLAPKRKTTPYLRKPPIIVVSWSRAKTRGRLAGNEKKRKKEWKCNCVLYIVQFISKQNAVNWQWHKRVHWTRRTHKIHLPSNYNAKGEINKSTLQLSGIEPGLYARWAGIVPFDQRRPQDLKNVCPVSRKCRVKHKNWIIIFCQETTS